MALTALERLALIIVRQKIFNGSGEYQHICPILSQVAREKPELREACIRIRTYIGEQLKGLEGNTLESWQEANGFSCEGRNHVQDRLDWITWMLEE